MTVLLYKKKKYKSISPKLSRNERKRKQKEIAQYLHAKRRAKERYNLDFTPTVKGIFLNRISSSVNAYHVGKQDNGTSMFIIVYEQKAHIVCYCTSTKEIRTFLPKDCLEYYFENPHESNLGNLKEEKRNELREMLKT